jgi:signal transduction histidine kinase
LIGENVEFLHPGIHDEKSWSELMRCGELTFPSQARTGNGREVPVEIKAKHIAHGEREIIEWVERDRSERVRADEAREDQLAMVFHDLRSPLGNVISSLEMLTAALPQDERSADLNMLADIALRSSRRIIHLLNSLLDIRRLETGQPLDEEPSLLQLVIQEAVDQLRSIAQGRHVELIVQMPADLPEVMMDRDLILRVVYNLIDNAIKHTRPYTNVTITAEVLSEGNAVAVAVADNGPGIPAEFQSSIFNKYQRVKRDGAPKGLGLGLALCRMAIEAHGGHIWMENTPGGGATFKFTLPLTVSL